MIQDHTTELIKTRSHSHSLLAYVGTPQLAEEIRHCKLSNDMVTAITGYRKHQMEFVSECNSGVKAKDNSNAASSENAVAVSEEVRGSPTKDFPSRLRNRHT
jgi:CTP:phosphocholine cytidylyltransferase-like protein